MKNGFSTLLLAAVLAAAGCTPPEKTIIFLSTNDIHAKIERFPQLAQAVEEARDTATVVLVDAGDRWTGNAYVDLARQPRRPIVDLMNRLGYDAGTFGNHEFDSGQAFLGEMLGNFDFEVIGANVLSDTVTFPQPPAYTILERDGLRLGLVGVVTNYDTNNHPAGLDENFAGLTFPDPQLKAAEYASLRDRVDLLVLVSHMGDERDVEFATRYGGMYDLIIGGHSHQEIDTMVNGTLITQTGKYLKNIGVTQVTFRGRKPVGLSFRNVPLAGYDPDDDYSELVEEYFDNPELNRPIGSLAKTAEKVGLANLFTRLMAERTGSRIGLYHIGGVRLDSMARGGVSTAEIYDLEPFSSTVCTMVMTPEQLRRLIMTKFNDPVNVDESHRIDLYATTPYTILTDEQGEAVDVLFPELTEGKTYKVSIGDYPFKNYADFAYTDEQDTGILITDLLLDYFSGQSPVTPDNTIRQQIRPRQ